MMLFKRGIIYKVVSKNTQGISKSTKEIVKEIRCSYLQALNKLESQKLYGSVDLTAQVFTSHLDTTTLMSSSYLELDNMTYLIKEVYNYPPSHAILLLKKV